jgi:hypothetical protein
MFKVMTVVMLLISAQGLGATSGHLPTKDEVQALLAVGQDCIKVKIEITRFTDMAPLPATEIPLCVALPAVEATGDCTPGAPLPDMGDYSCPVAIADPTQKYLRLSPPGYDFLSYFTADTHWAAGGYFAPGRQSLPYLWTQVRVQLQDAWSSRLTSILSQHKAELPVAFAALILPELGDEPLDAGPYVSRAAPDAPLSVKAASILEPVQAIGYDAAGRGYGVHISTVAR